MGTERLTPEVVEAVLAKHGAPLSRPSEDATADLVDAFVEALRLSHSNATLLRLLPSVVGRNASELNFRELRVRAAEAGVAAELGMVLELTGDLLQSGVLAGEAKKLEQHRPLPLTLRSYFEQTNRWELELAKTRTPPSVRRWGFLMNMDEDSFRSVLEKHLV